jgi:GNAT superfamily N-acetyltransferase
VEVRLLTTAPNYYILEAASWVYVAAFAQPPYGEGEEQGAAFAERVERYARERDGFRFVVAVEDSKVMGVCLAVLAGPGDWWRDKAAAALERAVADRWLGGSCLEVVHVAVPPFAQRRGIGRLMHDVLIGGRPAPTGILACHPAAVPAQLFYQALGWTVLTRNFPAGGEDFWLMARDL